MAMNNGICPICGGLVTKETQVDHVNMGFQVHRHLYKASYTAFCESCQIVLERNIVGMQDTGWVSSSVAKRDIVAELSDEEVAQAEKSVAHYPNLLTQWQEFIAQKRETDVVCRFQEADSPYEGFTIKRGHHLIGRFPKL
jgi:hypothetical protein